MSFADRYPRIYDAAAKTTAVLMLGSLAGIAACAEPRNNHDDSAPAVTAEPFPAFSTHAESEPAENTGSDTSLPPIDEPGWVLSNGFITSTHKLAQANYTDGRIHVTYPARPETPKLPDEYKAAFTDMLENDLLEFGLQSGHISGVSLTSAEYDNGHFDPSDDTIGIELSNGQALNARGEPATRIYVDSRIMEFVGVHEAMHAFSDDWYKYVYGKETTSDPILAKKIERVNAACKAIRDESLSDFLTTNTAAISQSFHDTAANFTATVAAELAAGTVSTDQTVKRVKYAGIMEAVADTLDSGDTSAYEKMLDDDCRYVDLFELPYLMPGIDQTQMGVYFEFPETNPIAVVERQLKTAVNDHYKCVKDSEAERLAIGYEDKIGGGHSYDNPTEGASSFFTVLYANPSYLKTCMESMEAADREKLLDYTAAVVDITAYTNPKVLDIIRGHNPEAAQIIDEALARR